MTDGRGYFSGRTLVPILQTLPAESHGVEIGVCRGSGMLYTLEDCPNISLLYGVDPWKEYPEMTQAEVDIAYAECVIRIKPMIDCGRAKILRMPSLEAVKLFENEWVDYIFVDGQHTKPAVVNDLGAWVPHVRSGGIVSGDDWGIPGVAEGVREYRERTGITSELIILGGCWYWIK